MKSKDIVEKITRLKNNDYLIELGVENDNQVVDLGKILISPINLVTYNTKDNALVRSYLVGTGIINDKVEIPFFGYFYEAFISGSYESFKKYLEVNRICYLLEDINEIDNYDYPDKYGIKLERKLKKSQKF